MRKKKYDVTVDLDRLFEGDLDHITYAGYGFSGSGKTFTLIESPESIVSQVSAYLNDKGYQINLNVHEWYDEKKDSGCMGKISWENFKESINLPHKEAKDYNADVYGGKTIVEKIEYINTQRKTHKLGPDKNNIYRTSIRRTTFNDQSSRAHMFIDINTKDNNNNSKKITILDMAGAEDANVIQKDYFETLQKIELENFDEKQIIKDFETIQTKIGGVNYSAWRDSKKNSVGTLIKRAYNSLTKIFNTTKINSNTGKYVFIMDPNKWVTLFKDIYGDNWKRVSDYEYFVKEFNQYQFCKQLSFLKILYDSLKKLEDSGNYNIFTFSYISKNINIQKVDTYQPKGHMKGFYPKTKLVNKYETARIKADRAKWRDKGPWKNLNTPLGKVESYIIDKTKETYRDLFENSTVDDFFKTYIGEVLRSGKKVGNLKILMQLKKTLTLLIGSL